MSEWIHVITATKVPQKRSSQSSPFEEIGFDPNDNSPFGPLGETMFLPVTRDTPPTVDRVLFQVVQATTLSDVGKTIAGAFQDLSGSGGYADGDWVVDYTTPDQTLEASLAFHEADMLAAKTARLDAGYDADGHIFQLSDSGFQKISTARDYLNTKIQDAGAPPSTKLAISDLSNVGVDFTSAQLTNHLLGIGDTISNIETERLNFFDGIALAIDAAGVKAVTFDFDQY